MLEFPSTSRPFRLREVTDLNSLRQGRPSKQAASLWWKPAARPSEKPTSRCIYPVAGARASLELRHQARPADFAIVPFAQYWWVDDSTADQGWYEPRNQSFQYGLSLIWRF